jgi:hypothetical protein
MQVGVTTDYGYHLARVPDGDPLGADWNPGLPLWITIADHPADFEGSVEPAQFPDAYTATQLVRRM